jgi:hypothetical protein
MSGIAANLCDLKCLYEMKSELRGAEEQRSPKETHTHNKLDHRAAPLSQAPILWLYDAYFEEGITA